MAKPIEQPGEEEQEQEQVPHAFWSGIIAFGLVSLPVSLFPANRGRTSVLKMVDPQGNLLHRQFFCPQDNRALEREEIIRGYEVEKDHYVTVEDEELDALEPEKSREIDLKRFVPLSAINPIYFERAYFLVPDGDTTKAYRLLAKTMEDKQQAGIATFVMRGKEYLVAIIAEGGILRAETLRFYDELRSPEMIGLPKRQTADPQTLKRIRAAIGKSMHKQLDRALLSDQYTQKLMQHIDEKLKAGTDILPAPEEPEAAEVESNVIDLMQVLKARLQGQQIETFSPTPSHKKKQQSKSELYEQAQELEIPGRSKMSKQELIEALAIHSNKKADKRT